MSEEISIPVACPLPGVKIRIKVKIESQSETQSVKPTPITGEPIDVHDIRITITPEIETSE